MADLSSGTDLRFHVKIIFFFRVSKSKKIDEDRTQHTGSSIRVLSFHLALRLIEVREPIPGVLGRRWGHILESPVWIDTVKM